MAGAVLTLVTLLGSCSSTGDQAGSEPTRTPPADPVARFQELAELKDSATFHVIYSLKTGYDVDEEEFAWLQDGQRVRWDYVNTSKGHIGGRSSIDDGVGSGLTCVWATLEDNATADVRCSPGAYGWGLELDIGSALGGFFLFPWFAKSMEFRGYGEVLGVEVECFGTERRDFAGHICQSSEGVPMEIESEVRTGGQVHRYQFTAIEVRPPPGPAELLTPIIPDAPLGTEQDLRGVPLAELALPAMPIVEEFLGDVSE